MQSTRNPQNREYVVFVNVSFVIEIPINMKKPEKADKAVPCEKY